MRSRLIIRVFSDVALVVLGFVLAVAWDNIKEQRMESKEKGAIITMLKMEFAENCATINEDLVCIQETREARQNGKRNMAPLSLLKEDAWMSAKLRNKIFIRDTIDLMKLVNLYSFVHLVNERIQFRENYRISNQAASNYDDAIAILDHDIEDVLNRMLSILKDTENSLDKIYPVKISGPRFVAKDGMISEVTK